MKKQKSAPSVATVTTRDPKGLKFVSIIESAYNKAGLSDGEAQRVKDTPGLAELVSTFIGENRSPNKFRNEEVKSTHTYPADYKLKSIAEQIKILHERFSDVSWGYFRPDEKAISLPTGAEGLFAIPRWEKVASSYNDAVEKALGLLKQTRTDGFYNYREGQLGQERLRQTEHTIAAWKKLGEAQNEYDILVVPARFGLRHRGRSVRRARECFQVNEFGLGAFAVGCMLLTHPEREVQWAQLHIDCAGDEFKSDGAADFSDAPNFYWRDGRLRFDADWYDRASGNFSSVSGFLPQ